MTRGLVGDTGLLLAATLLLLAGIARLPVLLLVALVLLTVTGLTALWRRFCLNAVEYHRSFSQHRAFVGETVELSVQIINRKLLPLPWLEVEDELPEELGLEGGKIDISTQPLRMLVRGLLSLRWYERVTRRYQVQCHARGYHTFGPVQLRSGDIFGFFSNQVTLPGLDRLLVYPQVVPLEELGLPSKQPFGDRKAQLRVLEDPLRIAGVREYVAGDSLKRVHWKASARTQRLQVKLQEPSATLDVLLFLNITTFIPDWQGSIPVLLEEAITVAASLATHSFEQDYRVGLYVNTSAFGSDQQVKLPPARDPDQITRMLEALAKVSGFSTISMESFLQRESRNLPWGATIVLVTAVTTEAMLASLLRMRRAGHRVAMLLVGGHALPSDLPGIQVYNVGRNSRR